MKQVLMNKLPKCQWDDCDEDAEYDAPTPRGWGYLCEEHYNQFGGEGGSKLVLREKKELKLLAGTPVVDTRYVPDGWGDYDAYADCPTCGEARPVEMCANYEIKCQSCGQHYRCRSAY
jgi:hypothetical protein